MEEIIERLSAVYNGSPLRDTPTTVDQPPSEHKKKKVTDLWIIQQRERISQLREYLLVSMQGSTKDTLRSQSGGSKASALGMHQANDGSDSYDPDFALSLLSQEQDALYEIDEALKRIELGTYGVCEMSGEAIMRQRLEALPFTRYTVKCQAKIERQKRENRAKNATVSAEEISPEVLPKPKEEIDKLSSSDFAIYSSQIKAKGRSTTPVGGRKV
jgi:RNA polymerase-binding transcription factor DksA